MIKKIAKDTNGMALVICLLIMTVAAMMAIGISTDSTIDGKISRNQRDLSKNFYIADGTNQLEVPRISSDPTLAISDITKPAIIDNDENSDGTEIVKTLSQLSTSLPDPPTYRSRIRYHFARPNKQAGYSFNLFNNYYYSTRTRARRNKRNKTGIRTVETKVGPKI